MHETVTVVYEYTYEDNSYTIKEPHKTREFYVPPKEKPMHPACADGLHFLQHCLSKPLTLRDLKVGDKFIFFPYDGDDDGHGGFRSGSRLFEKIEPYRPDEEYLSPDYRNVAREVERPDVHISIPLDSKVIKIVGV